MRPEALSARILGVRQLFERTFGAGVQIEVVHPLKLESDKVHEPPKVETKVEPVTHPPSSADRLSQIREFLGDCRRCQLCVTRKNIVFGVGNPEAELVVLGEAPGEHEDHAGEPFVGRAGQMLDKMLKNVLGYEREQVYILNVMKCRPPDNRDPDRAEIESCLPFLEMQLEAIAPKAILLMGAVALRTLFQTQHGISRHRGEWMEYKQIPVMPTFHPAYLLRRPEDKRLTLADLMALRERLAVRD